MSASAPRLITELPGPKARAAIARDKEHTSPSYTRAYPLVVKTGQGTVIEDVDGNLFLDFTAGIAVNSTGHCHPKVVEAIQDQATKLLHFCGSDFYYEPMIQLAAKLAAIAPGPAEKRVLFTNSGAEAIEAAFKLARYATGRQHVVSFLGAFHGRTFGALSLTGSKVAQRAHFAPLVPEVHHVGYGYCYRCPYNLTYGTCGIECVSYIERELFTRIVSPEEVAAIFVEPIQGEGGYIVPPPEYLGLLAEICERHGILLVADEVQSGMGRTGKMFAVEHWGVEPDIICVAKGLASGMPLGAMIAKSSIMTWEPGTHASTFGGNPVACRAALATIDLIENGLLKNAEVVGAYLKKGLTAFMTRYSVIGDVRGLGLMVGIELVKDRITKEPVKKLRDTIVYEAFKNGLLLLGCGESSIRFCPPLLVTEEEVDTALTILARIFESVPSPSQA